MLTQNSVPIIILGMHRSGTSCLAGTLEQAGVYFGNVSHNNKYNKKGNKENNEVIQLNDEILEYNKASWNIPPNKLSWNNYHEKKGEAIVREYNCVRNVKYWGFKDPRTLLTLAFWNHLLPNAKYIGAYRNPASVAKSLYNREEIRIDIDAGLDLWFKYNQEMISFHEKKPFPVISFDLSSEDYIKKLEDIKSFLHLPNTLETDFFDKKLRTSDISLGYDTYPHQIQTILDYLNLASISTGNHC